MTARAAFRRRPRAAVRARGLTLVEVMITLVIFVALAWMMLLIVQEIVKGWTRAERQRVVYERAAGAMDRIVDDLSAVQCTEPPGVDQVLVRFIGDISPKSGAQRMMFVRSFEAGPERALTLFAGDGRSNDIRFEPPDDDDSKKKAPPPSRGAVDQDYYTGKKVGDYRALGGMAQVAYFVEDQTLYRSIRAPADGKFADILTPQAGTPMVTDVLYFALDYWSQYTYDWNEPPKGSKSRGPEKIWDSTRGLGGLLGKFVLHRDGSVDDPEDDVFPMKVRITITVDSPMPRCTFTKLEEDIGGNDGMVFVESTQGFPKGGTPDSYILIGDEWAHYKEKTDEAFKCDLRGARGTVNKDHAVGSVVRRGETFSRVVFINGHREDWVKDEDYWARKNSQQSGRARRGN
ncbi:MAG: prepilin-type N-terminal cleavage/methylation domain-containing protein [Planctomycetota bacterium]|nr:prepilin-type N-terminal cleavage/methylation domain-containing protein [Planctomycetota bacterium]